jgi:hypothetical protein
MDPLSEFLAHFRADKVEEKDHVEQALNQSRRLVLAGKDPEVVACQQEDRGEGQRPGPAKKRQ